MKLLLDQGLPRSAVLHLRTQGIEATHVGDKGLATASDSKILECGREEGMVAVTLDADFHALLALSGSNQERRVLCIQANAERRRPENRRDRENEADAKLVAKHRHRVADMTVVQRVGFRHFVTGT